MVVKFNVFQAFITHKFAVSVYGEIERDEKEKLLKQMRDWCDTIFKLDTFTISFNCFYFNTEQQRTWFLLKWS